jgi:YfiH family protein
MQALLNAVNPSLLLLQPQWPAPQWVVCGCTTRQGGVSGVPWDSLNLGDHVGDVESSVRENRHRLQQHVHRQGAGSLAFLQQVHGVEVLEFKGRDVAPVMNGADAQGPWVADGALTQDPAVCLVVMVADCLPILLTDRSGRWVAALHAGWRGLAGHQGVSIVSQALAALAERGCAPTDLMAWLGPCIGPKAFEVGDDVRAAFVGAEPTGSVVFDLFAPAPSGEAVGGQVGRKWWADLAGLARHTLNRLGVQAVYGNDSSEAWCTVTQEALFFSHRRDAKKLGSSGRLGVFIGLRA